MKRRVLITGGAGYIGSVLTRHLLENDYGVTVLDNFLYGQNSLLDCCANPEFKIVRGDVRNADLLSEAMGDCEFIVHLAALVGAPVCDKDSAAATSVNVDGTKQLVALRKKGQKILFPCTNSGYGIGQKDKFCTEETPLRPISLYGRTKVEAEKLILESGNSISFRLATVFGASSRMRLDLLVNNFVYRAVTDRFLVVFQGNFRRNYIHVGDVARVFQYGMEHFSSMKNDVFNVGLSDANLSKLELCEAIRRHIPKFVYLESSVGEDQDKRDYIVSNEKIERLGFRPSYSLDLGIEELKKAYAVIGSAISPSFSNI